MIEAPAFAKSEAARARARGQSAALDLARRLPALTLAARAAASLLHGAHGGRRAGSGETFWQFRPFVSGEAAQSIDWRRSSRDDRLYVREREWEGAQRLWIWADLSPSMVFGSTLAQQAKCDRALVLTLALADALARGGERVGYLGLTRPQNARDLIERIGLALAQEAAANGENFDDLPPPIVLHGRERAVLIGDFLVDPALFEARLAALAGDGARGHIVMIADPLEEAFPFAGQTEFYDEDGAILRAGRAEQLQQIYLNRLRAHRERLGACARARGWTLALHVTDRPAAEALLALQTAIAAD